jgi:FKBP-type peptidyl-prolyl cis-trans isomerase
MKKLKACSLILSVILFAAGCTNNNGLKKTKSGILYKIISDNKGQPAKPGQYLKLNLIQKVKDSVIYNSAESMPAYVRVDSARPSYSVSEVFSLLRKGDSAVVILLGDSIAKKSGRPLPPNLKGKDKITFQFRVLDLFPTQDVLLADRQKEMSSEKERETKALEDYIAKNKINAQKTPEGTFVEIKSLGDGPAVDSGKLVSVLYTGKSFPSGKEFESNMHGPRSEPVKFIVGNTSGMIRGWDDGLRLFKKGGKGSLYIPAFLAYDANPGPSNKPFENLIFDVEIVDVVDAPPPTKQGPTPVQGMHQPEKPVVKKAK